MTLRRREFIVALSCAAAWPLAARAQRPAMPVIGYLDPGSSLDRESRGITPAFRRGLAEAGYIEARNITIEYRWADNQYDRLPALAADLVTRRVAVIASIGSTASAVAAKGATTTIPIIFTMGADPVQIGLVASLSRPGGNMTGVSFLVTQAAAKMLEMLHEMVPDAGNVAALMNPANPNSGIEEKELLEAARRLGLELYPLKASNPREIEAAFEALLQQRARALYIEGDPFFGSRGRQLATLTVRHAIPSIFQTRDFADVGGLMSYGADIREAARIAGGYVARILKGDKPADLPVQLSTKVELVINVTTAKALDLNLPLSLRGRADELIE
jgi:putative ABC transport system substrate-binding protein